MKAVKKDHSDTGASGMDRWDPCPGSVALCALMPKSSSEYADEGTLAHTLGDFKLLGKPIPQDLKEKVKEFSDMEEAVDIYVDHVKDLWRSCFNTPNSQFHSEFKFSHPDIHAGFRGTADSVIYDAKDKIFYVTDYKHGVGVPVEAIGNKQLCYYGIGALLALKVPVSKVVLTIVQPRYSAEAAIKSWEIDTVDLMEFLADLLAAIKRTEDPDAALVPGDKQCRFCSAKPICPALKEQALIAARADFQVEKLGDLSPEVIGDLMSKVEVIEAWCKGVKQFAYSEAIQGRMPAGYKLVPKRATRKWVDIVEAGKKLATHVNSNILHELQTEPELKTPAQVEKIIGGKAGKELVAGLCVAVSSGDTLVPLDDSRQETNKSDRAKAMFGELT